MTIPLKNILPQTKTLSEKPQTVVRTNSPTSNVYVGELLGNALTASSLNTGKTIQLLGDVTGSVVFDGSSNVQIQTTTVVGGTGSASLDKAIQTDFSNSIYWYLLYSNKIKRINVSVYPTITQSTNSTDWANRETLIYS